MPLSIPCPQCKKSIPLSRTTLGKKVKCPACGRSFVADEEGERVEELQEQQEAPVAPSAAPRSRSKPAAGVRKQTLLRVFIFLLGLAGAAGAGFIGAIVYLKLQHDAQELSLKFALAQAFGEDATAAARRVKMMAITAYVGLAAAALAGIGSLLALRGRGVVPAVFLMIPFAALLLLNEKSYIFTAPLLLAGLFSLALGPGVPRRSALRLLLQMVGGALAGVLLMIAFMARFQPEALPMLPEAKQIIGGAALAGPGATSKPKITPEQVRDGKADFTLTAQELFDEYKKDDKAAHEKYEGKILEISGVVDSCKGSGNESILNLAVNREKSDVLGGVGGVMQEKECWARHSKGQKVKLRGVWGGKAYIGAAIVHAIVLESDPNTTPLYTAEQLAREYESDSAVLMDRYENKPLVVKGTLLKKEVLSGFKKLILKGTDKTSVSCRFSWGENKEWEEAKEGTQVTVFGDLEQVGEAKDVHLEQALLIMGETTAQPAPVYKPGDVYAGAVKDPAAAAAMIDKAGADVKLAPLEFEMSGVAMTLMAPEGARLEKTGKIIEIHHGEKFSESFTLFLAPGRSNLAAAQKYWASDKEVPTKAYVIATDDTVLRNVRVKKFSHWKVEPTFLCTKTLGHVDVHMYERGDRAFTLDQCLLMMRCARTLALKPGYQPPQNLEDLKKCGVTVNVDESTKSQRVHTDETFTDAAMPYVVKFAPDAEALSLWSPLTDQALRQVAGFKKLRSFEFFGVHGDPYSVDGSGLAGLTGLKGITYIWISRAMISDGSLLNLRPLTGLKVLRINDAPITGSGFKLLKSLTQLEELALDQTKIEDANLKNIAAFSNLKKLSMNYAPITDAGLANLANLKKLEEFSAWETAITDAGVQHLKGLTTLKNVNLMNTKIGDGSLLVLKTLPNLDSLMLTETMITDQGMKNLVGAPALKYLYLEKTKITDAGADELKKIKTLSIVDVKNTAVTKEKIAELKKAIPDLSVN